MRIWDYRLLPYLPDTQFKGQLRELVAIMHDWKDKGKTNHLLINKVMEYPKSELTSYFLMYALCYGDRYNNPIAFKYYQEFYDFANSHTMTTLCPFKGWHNDTYLNICMWNLYEKHLAVGKSRVTDEEWARLCEGYKKITGKEFIV